MNLKWKFCTLATALAAGSSTTAIGLYEAGVPMLLAIAGTAAIAFLCSMAAVGAFLCSVMCRAKFPIGK